MVLSATTMYTRILFIALQVACCVGFAAYEMFEGFELPRTTITTRKPTTTTRNVSTTTEDPLNFTRPLKFKCAEEERPSNIGPYEVPTQRDLALLTRKTLKKMFGSYHQKALMFLDDIKQATRATVEMEEKCRGNKALYRLCVKNVSNRCELITKSLVISLERQRHDVAAFSESTLCSMSAMKDDPVKLVKILAMEEVALDFALPAFLRLLSACSNYCISSYKEALKPLTQHMTDADLIIKHFLSRKNYKQLITRK